MSVALTSAAIPAPTSVPAPALTGTPVLDTPRLILRAPAPGDVGAFTDFITSDRARFVGGPLTEEGRAWRVWASVIGHWAMRGFGMFTVQRRDDGRAVGMIGPWYPDAWPEPEISWSLFSAADERQGFAAEAVDAVLDHVYGALGWTTAVSYIDRANEASAALARRVGAVHDPVAAVPQGGADWAETLCWRHAPRDVSRGADQPLIHDVPRV